MNKTSREVVHMREQHRPQKVKDIYYAIRDEHPNISKELAARIAIRQGKPGKQKQGPPYKAPLSKQSSFWCSFKDELEKLSGLNRTLAKGLGQSLFKQKKLIQGTRAPASQGGKIIKDVAARKKLKNILEQPGVLT